MELELPNFSLNLDFGNLENETPNKRVKKMSEEELHTSVEDQESINTSRATQFAVNLHYVPGKHGFNRASLQRSRRNPLKSTRNKNFPGF